MMSFYKSLKRNKLFIIFAGDRNKNLWFFAWVIALSFVAALFEGASFGFIFVAFSGLKTKSEVPTILQRYFISEYQGLKLFFLSVFLSIACQILRSALCYLSTIFSTRFALKIQKKVQSAVYDQILRLRYSFITRLKIGDLLECARAPVQSIMPILDAMNRLLVAVLTSIVIIAMMLALDFRLTFFAVLLFGFFVFIQKYIIKKILRASDDLSKHLMEVNQDASQMLQGIKVIQSFFQQRTVKEKIQTKIEDIAKTSEKMYILSNIVPSLNEMISVIVLGMILIFATLTIGVENESFLAILMTFLMISYRLSTRMQNALGILGVTSGYYGYFLRMSEMLADEGKEFVEEKGVPFTQSIEEIALDNVSFCYDEGQRAVLKKISFSIPKGAMLGVVGLSGAGKSSLIDLILRLYEPTEGKILANKTDIKTVSLASWRSKFGIVAQDPFLFDETIEENIRFGLNDVNKEQVLEAVKSAGVGELIEILPNGLGTVVGERGLRLSGGERQRIALARALLRNPEVLILDEATSNLDSHSESHIQNALSEIQKTKTLIVIAHRLSTIVHSDRIIVLENGEMIESGTHEELLKCGGRYFNLWEIQTRKQSEASLPV